MMRQDREMAARIALLAHTCIIILLFIATSCYHLSSKVKS